MAETVSSIRSRIYRNSSIIKMNIQINQKIGLSSFEHLSERTELLHFTTHRYGGGSKGNYASLNLGFNSGDESKQVIDNRKILCNHLDISVDRIIFPKQTHSATVKVIDEHFFQLSDGERTSFLTETDALITAMKQVCIAVKTADCVPVLLYDPVRQVAAAVHAGWRGTVQQIAKLTVKEMETVFDCKSENILAGIGPSISPDVYEVGEEVWHQFDSQFYTTNEIKGKRLLNLWKANRFQLLHSGLKSANIIVSGLCTFSNKELFFSARRDGAKTGRMASGVMIK
jgi:YfiH family protein